MAKKRSSIEPKTPQEILEDQEKNLDQRDEERDDQKENLEIDLHIREEITTDIREKNMVTRPRMWGKKSLEKKNRSDPKRNLEKKETTELKKVFETIRQENHSKNSIKKLCSPAEFF